MYFMNGKNKKFSFTSERIIKFLQVNYNVLFKKNLIYYMMKIQV